MIMPKSDLIPDETSGGLSTVAVRCPSHPVARAIIRAAGVPLAAPSANVSGRPSPTNAKYVFEDMNGKIDMIVDGGQSEVGVESTVVTLAQKPARLLRPGGITAEQLKSVLGEVVIDDAVLHMLKSGEKAASPGMKYKHYAPKADVTIVKGSFDAFRRFVAERVTALCYALRVRKNILKIMSHTAEPTTPRHRLTDCLTLCVSLTKRVQKPFMHVTPGRAA